MSSLGEEAKDWLISIVIAVVLAFLSASSSWNYIL